MRRTIILAALAAGLLLAGCQQSGDTSPQAAPTSVDVTIEGFAYEPETIEVPAGTEITWTNRDDFAHTVTAGTPDQPRPGTLDGVMGELGEMNAAGTTFTTTLEEAGTIRYFCRFHPSMVARVVVGP